MSAQHAPVRGCAECAWGKVAGCWRCGSRAASMPRFVIALASGAATFIVLPIALAVLAVYGWSTP